jgi:dihydrodipicolinate reductase
MARVLGDGYDIEELWAHVAKRCTPGTACTQAEMAAQAGYLSRMWEYIPARVDRTLDREIGIQVVRGGILMGEHTVCFIGGGELG